MLALPLLRVPPGHQGARTHAGSGPLQVRRRLLLARLGGPISLATRSLFGLRRHLSFLPVVTLSFGLGVLL